MGEELGDAVHERGFEVALPHLAVDREEVETVRVDGQLAEQVAGELGQRRCEVGRRVPGAVVEAAGDVVGQDT